MRTIPGNGAGDERLYRGMIAHLDASRPHFIRAIHRPAGHLLQNRRSEPARRFQDRWAEPRAVTVGQGQLGRTGHRFLKAR